MMENLQVVEFIRKLTGTHVDEEERRILDAIKDSGLKSMRVVGRGTLVVDPREVTGTEKFKQYVSQARQMVKHPD